MKRAKLHAVVIAALTIGLALPALAAAQGKSNDKKVKPPPCSPIPVVATFSGTDELPEAKITNDELGDYIDGDYNATVELQAGSSCSNDLIINLLSSPNRYINLDFGDSPPCDNPELESTSHFMNIDRVATVPITGGQDFDWGDWDSFCKEDPSPLEVYNLCLDLEPENPSPVVERWVLRRATYYVDEDIGREAYHLRFQATPSMLEEVPTLAITAYIRVEHLKVDGQDQWILRPENLDDINLTSNLPVGYPYTLPDVGRDADEAAVYRMAKRNDGVCGTFTMPFELVVWKQH